MTGPEHYCQAERLVARWHDSGDSPPDVLIAAQVHATLALAAATALKGGFWDETETTHGRTLISWADAAGRPAAEFIPCPSEAAYARHMRAHEVPCDGDFAAVTRRANERRNARRANDSGG